MNRIIHNHVNIVDNLLGKLCHLLLKINYLCFAFGFYSHNLKIRCG